MDDELENFYFTSKFERIPSLLGGHQVLIHPLLLPLNITEEDVITPLCIICSSALSGSTTPHRLSSRKLLRMESSSTETSNQFN
jgi:hypothetical protein